MPHIVVNVWPGRSDEEKRALANRIALDVAEEVKLTASLKNRDGILIQVGAV